MAKCEACGNDYDKAFQGVKNGKTHTFDSFEGAIHALAPTCDHCGIRIVGHGLEKAGTFYCSITAPKAKACRAYVIGCKAWLHPQRGVVGTASRNYFEICVAKAYASPMSNDTQARVMANMARELGQIHALIIVDRNAA